MRGVKKYDDEFKQNAVKKILDGQSVASVSRELASVKGFSIRGSRGKSSPVQILNARIWN